MDQKSLYEMQTGSNETIEPDNNTALIGRDQFVIDCITTLAGVERNTFNVAELSIGEGRLTHALLQNFPGMNLNCVDISTNRINYVQSTLKNITHLKTKCVKFTECNFDVDFGLIESDEYNVVIALDIMEHVLDVFGFVENCHRILKSGGQFFLRVPNIAYIKHRVGLFRGKLPVTASWFDTPEELTSWRDQHGWDGGHLHLFTVPILYDLLESYGFQIKECSDPGTRFQKLRNIAPNLLYANPLIVAQKN